MSPPLSNSVKDDARHGAQFVTTQTDIGFLTAAWARIAGIRRGLDQVS